MSSLSALDRLRRLLAVIPWVVDQGGVELAAVAERFDYPLDQLLQDLEEVVFFVGVHPFTPDCLIEVSIVDDRVWIAYADWFTQPLRLAPDEIMALLVAGRSVAVMADGDDFGPLERALTKMAASLDPAAGEAVQVRLGTGDGDALAVFRRAARDGRVVEIDYYSYGRDAHRVRRIEPHRVFADRGHWYAVAFCREAEDRRLFRLDRVRRFEETGEVFPPEAPDDTAAEVFPLHEELPVIELALDAEARWVADQYPHLGSTTSDDGGLVVQLPVASEAWLARLLLRLGPAARVVQAPVGLGDDLRADTARRILSRYGAARRRTAPFGG